MKGELEKLSELVLLKLAKEERKEVAKRIKAMRSLLNDLKKVEVGEEPPFLPSLKLKLRKDEPLEFDSKDLLKVVPKHKDRYVMGPKTV